MIDLNVVFASACGGLDSFALGDDDHWLGQALIPEMTKGVTMVSQFPRLNLSSRVWGRSFWMTVLLGMVCCVGCGKAERPFTDNSRDPEAFAADVKTVVLDHVALARRSKEPADELQQVVNFLADRAKRPQGNYAELYDKLYALAEQIHQACEAAGGKPATLTQQLAELEELAGSLPGRVDTAVGQVDAG